MPGFDVDAARQAGYSDDDILGHLTQSRNFDVQGALQSGYSKADVINHLAGTPAPTSPATTNIPTDKGYFGTLGSDIAGLPHMGMSILRTVAPFPEASGVRSQAFHELADPNINLVKQGIGELSPQNWLAAPVHIAEGLTPGIGPMAHQAASDIEAGRTGAGLARLTEIAGPKALSDLPLSDIGEAAKTTGTVAKGALKGGFNKSMELVPVPLLASHGVKVPAFVRGAMAGEAVGRYTPYIGSPEMQNLAGAIGLVTPGIRGAIEGGRNALADLRSNQALERLNSRIPYGGADLQPTPLGPQPLVEPIPGALPSGRKVGGIQNQAATPPAPAPAITPFGASAESLDDAARTYGYKGGFSTVKKAGDQQSIISTAKLLDTTLGRGTSIQPINAAPALSAQPLTPLANVIQPVNAAPPLSTEPLAPPVPTPVQVPSIPAPSAPAGLPDLVSQRYIETGAKHADIRARNTFDKNTAIASHLIKNGVTPETLPSLSDDAINNHIKTVNAEIGSSYKSLGAGSKGRGEGRTAEQTRADILLHMNHLLGRLQ